MKEDRAYIIRKTFIVITLILLFATAGIVLMATQIKTVNLDFYGSEKQVKTVATTVGGFLTQNKIYITDEVEVSPSIDTKLQNGLEIKVSSKKTLSKIDLDGLSEKYNPTVAKIVEEVNVIPYTEQIVETALINRGSQNVSQEGKEGQKTTKFLIKYSKDQEIYRAEIETKITSDPVNRVVEIGTKIVAPTVARSAALTSPSSIYVDAGFRQYRIGLPVEKQKFAYNMCQQYGIQYELLLAIMYKESGFNPNAIGAGQYYGLCQIGISNLPSLTRALGVTNLLNPYENIQSGAYWFSRYINKARTVRSGDYAVEVYALASYNMGEAGYLSSGLTETSYSRSIMGIRDRLIANGGL